MSLITHSSLVGLLFITTIASAAANPAVDKSAAPAPETMHRKLTQISQNPALLSAALKDGQQAASVCRHCHGAGGNSTLPDVPNLASQNAGYLLEQMNKFAHGQRKSAFMEGLIKALAPDERISIALFLSQQPVTRKPTASGTQNLAGKALYDKLCVSCHGTSATGSQTIPRLAGQQVKYVKDSLKRYRNGSGERVDPKMASYTRNLKDADIQNLAAYLSTLQP